MKNFNVGNRHAYSLQEFYIKYSRPVTVQQIQNLDKTAIERYGIPSIVLMENAGRAVAEEIKKYFPENAKTHVKGMLREYLHYKILEILFNSEIAKKLIFIKRTAIRIIHGAERFTSFFVRM
jgi:hypothetical protein